jgi:integration host factor subunit beta
MTSEPQTITKKELVNRISDQTGQTKVVVKDILQKFLDEIIDELAHGNRLEFREFGVFEVRERATRVAQNPRTLEKVVVPAKRVVKFKVGRTMREKVCEDEPKQRPAPKARVPEPPVKPPARIVTPTPPPVRKPPPSNSPF